MMINNNIIVVVEMKNYFRGKLFFRHYKQQFGVLAGKTGLKSLLCLFCNFFCNTDRFVT